jgi:hypothetical protein
VRVKGHLKGHLTDGPFERVKKGRYIDRTTARKGRDIDRTTDQQLEKDTGFGLCFDVV